MTERAAVEVRVVLRDDDGQELTMVAHVTFEAPREPSAVELARGVAGSIERMPVTRVLDECCVALERWSDEHDARPIGHRAAVAAALDIKGSAEGAARETETVAILGTTPLRYPDVGSLAGKKGARTDAELPPLPSAETLTRLGQEAQAALVSLVNSVGGRHGLPPRPAIPIGHVDLLARVFEEWAMHYGVHRPDGIAFSRPGLWHALDRLVPLQDPNRWNRLRKEVIDRLVERGWERSGGIRGSSWWIPIGVSRGDASPR